VVLLALASCASLFESDEMPTEAPPLADMQEPLDRIEEPDDEAQRQQLELGGFTGIYVADARKTLEDMGDEAIGVRVARVVENSPGDAAGLVEDDLILAAGPPDGILVDVAWPSQWERIEREAAPGSDLVLLYDRAALEDEVTLRVAQRVRPAKRKSTERYREEQRVGVVLRTATAVEARSAGLGNGGGAVVVGLSRVSPWRRAGLVFGDLLVRVDGDEVAHPQVVLDAIRNADEDGSLELTYVRDGVEHTVAAPISRRAQEVTDVDIPFLYSYDRKRGETEWSLLLGLISKRSTGVAWEWTFLWFIDVAGGDEDRLVEEEQ
jgi:S1-C subfamily serine protease